MNILSQQRRQQSANDPIQFCGRFIEGSGMRIGRAAGKAGKDGTLGIDRSGIGFGSSSIKTEVYLHCQITTLIFVIIIGELAPNVK